MDGPLIIWSRIFLRQFFTFPSKQGKVAGRSHQVAVFIVGKGSEVQTAMSSAQVGQVGAGWVTMLFIILGDDIFAEEVAEQFFHDGISFMCP